MRIRYALIVLLAVLVTGCASFLQPTIDAAVSATLTAVAPTITPVPEATPTPDCATLTNQWLLDIGPLVRQWDDALAVALSTARISLSEPVAELQRIARELEDAPFPDCAKTARDYYIAYTGWYIKGFVEFMAKQGTDYYFSRALEYYDLFILEKRTLMGE